MASPQGHGGTGRKESSVPPGPQLWASLPAGTCVRIQCTGHRPRMQIRAGSRPRHTASFRGTQKAGGHPIWGPNYGTLCPANHEPSPGTMTQFTAPGISNEGISGL